MTAGSRTVGRGSNDGWESGACFIWTLARATGEVLPNTLRPRWSQDASRTLTVLSATD